ncbi:HAD-IA family hydrolase, partial [Eubacterium sp.]|uniref:HAD-IA family hydrolase n=1 Tax=Eubacterium sp. TaxID=142586 RepID=UPI003F09548F
RAVQRKKLAVSGIADIFDGVFISDEVGYEKPSVNFFKHVLANIPSVDTNEILIVGDSLTSDIKGGNNMDFKTCWFNPQSLPLKDGYTVNYQIKNAEDIFDILKFEG